MEGIFINETDGKAHVLRFYNNGQVIASNFLRSLVFNNMFQKIFDLESANPFFSIGEYNYNEEEINIVLNSNYNNIINLASHNHSEYFKCKIISEFHIELIKVDSNNIEIGKKEKYNLLKYSKSKNRLIIAEPEIEFYPMILIPANIKEKSIKDISLKEIYNHLGIEVKEIIKLNVPKLPNDKIEVIRNSFRIEGSSIIFIANSVFFLFFVILFIKSIGKINFLMSFVFFVFAFLFADFKKIKYTKVIKYKDKSAELFNKELNDYQRELSNVEKQNKITENNYNAYLEEINISITDKIETAKKEIYYQTLLPSIDYKSMIKSDAIIKGSSEEGFLFLLRKCFGQNVKINLKIDSRNNGYTPDFIVICPKSNLHIDIEIDEPYSYSEKSPIHYKNSTDDYRNEFFLNINWVVIRFSERQIICQPNDCIDLINNVINSINNKKIEIKYNVIKDKRWTYEESQIYIENSERKNYS